VRKIKIDPRLEKLIPPLQPDERAALEAALVASGGPTDPIVVWRETGAILDGHNRYAICQAHKLPFAVHEVSLPNHAAARGWMLDRALAKRNLTREQRILLRAQHGVQFTPGEESTATVKQARALLASGDAPRIAAALAGRMPLSTAYRAACKPPVRKRAAPPPAPPVADDLRSRRAEHDRREAAARAERALERVEQLEAELVAVTAGLSAPLPRLEPARLRDGKRRATAVALLSDVHFEERVERSDVIPNEYGPAIADRRLARFFAGTAWLAQHAPAFDIGELVLWLGGDMISGQIHDENVETSELPPAVASLQVAGRITSGIRQLLADLPGVTLTVPCSLGNHARTTKTVRAATGYGHSWEWLIYSMIAKDLAGEPRVRVHLAPEELCYVETLDFTLAFHHGHRIKWQGGIGGVTVPAIKAAHRWDAWRAADYYCFGHYHQRIDLGQIAFNGSVIGPNAYALGLGCTPEPAQQSFFLLDERRGKTLASPVWVAE